RDAPLTGGPEPVDTLEHSVLGRRWVYDGPFDPVYVAAVTTAILTGGTEAALESPDGTLWPSRGTARGSGSRTAGVAEPTRLVVTTDKGLTSVVSDGFTLAVRRVVDPQAHTDDLRLTGTWAGTDEPVLLATVRLTA
ncbi:MAG TPA: hypothetical protein VFP34_07055, partial [Microlunatus sp.]|nr:hypothetical protein [Microlunatus sp.]